MRLAACCCGRATVGFARQSFCGGGKLLSTACQAEAETKQLIAASLPTI